MNILLLTHEGQLTGSTYSISFLAQGLAARGHRVYVGCPAGSILYRMLRNSNVRCIAMRFRFKMDWANIKHLGAVVHQHGIELINAQSSLDRYSSVFARWLFHLDVKVIHTRRQMALSMGGFLKNLIYYQGTDKIVAVSEAVKHSLVQLGIPAAHIKVIYNGTPAEKYTKIDEALVAQLKMKLEIRAGDIVIGCCARLKHQTQLIRALQYVKTKVKVVFIGIEDQDEFWRIMAQSNMPHEICLMGSDIPNQIALNYIKLFTIKVLPSTTEGLSQSLLEAMALGVPVIATGYAGNLDLIRDGYNGLLFEHGNVAELAQKIDLLIQEPALRKRLSDEGKKTALEDFSIQKTIDQYEEFFMEMISNSVLT